MRLRKLFSQFGADQGYKDYPIKKHFKDFRATFKRAFQNERAFGKAFTGCLEQYPRPSDVLPMAQVNPMVELSCVTYSDIYMIADVPPDSSTSTTGFDKFELLRKCSSPRNDDRASQLSLPQSPTAQVTPAAYQKLCGSDSIYILDKEDTSDHGYSSEDIACDAELSILSNSVSNPELQYTGKGLSARQSPEQNHRLYRSKSQANFNQSTSSAKNDRLKIRRRSSISHLQQSHHQSHESNSIPYKGDSVRKSLEDGMARLTRRNASIEFAKAQRAMDESLLRGSITINIDSIKRKKDETLLPLNPVQHKSLNPSLEAGQDHQEGSGPRLLEVVLETTDQEVQSDVSTTNGYTHLKNELAALKSHSFEAQKQYESQLAEGQFQMSNTISMYQALHASHEELKAKLHSWTSTSSAKELSDALQCNADLLHQLHASKRARAVQADQIVRFQHQLASTVPSNQDLYNRFVEKCKEVHWLEGLVQTAQQSESQLRHQVAIKDRQRAELAKRAEDLQSAWQNVTSEMIDLKSEFERVEFQNIMFRDATSQDPGKTADMDHALEQLQKKVCDTEDRAIEAEENFMQLQKRTDEDHVVHKAEMKSYGDRNEMLLQICQDLKTSKQATQKAMDSFMEQIKNGCNMDALEEAFKSYFTIAKDNNARDQKLLHLTNLHSTTVEEAKSLRLKTIHLETAAKASATAYSDLEATHLKQRAELDVLKLQCDTKSTTHSIALAKKSQELTHANNLATSLRKTISTLQSTTPDARTNWFFRHLDREIQKANAAKQNAETRAENLSLSLHAKNEAEKRHRLSHGWENNALAQQVTVLQKDNDRLRDEVARCTVPQVQVEVQVEEDPASLAAFQKKVAQLKHRLATYDFHFSSRDWIKWSQHLRRVDEVRARTETKVREQLEHAVEGQVAMRLSNEYVLPLQELGAFLWGRIRKLEGVCGNVNMRDAERRVLVSSSERFGVVVGA